MVLYSFLLDRSSRVDGAIAIAIAGAGSILIYLERLSQFIYKVTGANQLIYISK